ncbi:MAG TPA: EthD domain-containing protein [Verrucomicrobiae bacterium]|nr:EthD domain-containing protein [Verrucomicrobiae bacterium]
MEKVIYVLWRHPAAELATFAERVRTSLVADLRSAGARSVRVNVNDADVTKAAGMRQMVLKPAPDAIVQVWVDSAIATYRAPIDAAISACAVRSAGYLVTESQPLVNVKHPTARGQRTYGVAQVALLRKPKAMTHEAWLEVWHNSHTQVAIETQSTFEYLQNVVIRALTPDAPAIDAIVEECFPPEAMTDYKAFFDAPGDEAKFKANLQRMLQSVSRFIEPGQIDVIPTSQYP